MVWRVGYLLDFQTTSPAAMGAQLHLISATSGGLASAKRELDVVFVHGLGGDPFSTMELSGSAMGIGLGSQAPQPLGLVQITK
jgi:hypothetical protein